MSEKSKKIHIIVNPVAGQDDTVISALNAAFHDSDFEWEIQITSGYGDGEQFAQAAIDKGADIIGVYGGDGTVGDVLNGVYPSDTPIALLSGGTGNGAAKVLGIPEDLEASAQYIADGNYDVMQADIGCINDRYFLLRVDIGKMVEVSEELDRDAKENFGMMSYYYAVAKTYLREEDSPFTFTLDDERTVERDGIAFIMLNLRRKSDDNHAENIQNGAFEFFMIHGGVLEFAKGVITYSDFFETDDMFEVFSAQKIKVETPEPFTVFADGEPVGETPITMELLPKAISLIVPKQP